MHRSVRPRARGVRSAVARVTLSLILLTAATPEASAISVIAPVGYRAFCLRFPSDDLCHARGAEVTLTLTPWLEELLSDINIYWNHRLTWASDETLYGRAEYWTVPTGGEGDCEDYALAKYGQLRRLGVPGGALSLVYGKLKTTGEGHAVLSVHTDQGLLVLGSTMDDVLPLAASEIAPVLVEDARLPAMWTAVQPAPEGSTIVADH